MTKLRTLVLFGIVSLMLLTSCAPGASAKRRKWRCPASRGTGRNRCHSQYGQLNILESGAHQ